MELRCWEDRYKIVKLLNTTFLLFFFFFYYDSAVK